MSLRRTLQALAAATSVCLIAACGGGGDSVSEGAPGTPPAGSATGTRLVVVGDSLADVGTFGFKATVQSAANPAAGYPVYPELVARAIGAGNPCNFFSSTDEGDTFTTHAGCTNFAVASAAIVNPVTRGGDDVPFSIQDQFERALAANGGNWRANDLIVVDAGANDAAGLADAYLDAQGGNAADQAVFVALLGQQLNGSTINDALAQSNGGSVAANLYMQQLARTFWNALKANTLDRGATRVAIVNVPDLTLTPRFRQGLTAGVSASQGPAAAAAFETAVRSWIVTFNTELARLVAGEPRVVVVDYFSDFTAQNTTPAAFGLTAVSEASCPLAVDFPQCTDAALDAAPPAGLAPGWWRTWLYSDRFHPSPRGHELLAAGVVRAVQGAGWR
ncbi:MAG TPA: SGNH/GDSL hydrolase family protein [Ramlibacter sp.]|jgi:phospholipase/lecithinase/hemolysin|uniref:SGNH/GDSL hydrolase family protein n=1 Tax=Ramlibacter sp. TaxID=1917967 RepID=UPI002D633CA7|nr:SGNH/GDSL hydrolase family protein [Ramlibacter sp.]HZY19638.1 SGNH/GDSL hydrolase family protein [Ramlibacter sp.]